MSHELVKLNFFKRTELKIHAILAVIMKQGLKVLLLFLIVVLFCPVGK